MKQRTKKYLLTLFVAILLVTASAVAVFADGTEPAGTEPPLVDGVYQIDSAEDLIGFAAYVNAGNKTINGKLMADIDLNPGYTFNADGSYTGGSTPSTWMPIENYTGNFDGNGKTVSGLYFNDNNKSNVGLFGYIGLVGEVKNVTVANSYINGLQYIGGVCGDNDGEIKNCHSTGTVSGNTYVGGVCGGNSGTLTNCSNTETVSGSGTDDNGYTYVGGVCGYNSGDITNCSNTGNVSGSGNVGGICGMSVGTITSCYNTGTVSGDGDFVGGVCGNNHSEDNGDYTGIITNCHNTGAVSGSGDPVGGVCGYNNGGITNCSNTGDVSSDDNKVGGVCGNNNGGITNCYNIGTVSSDDDMAPYVGGVCGYNYTGNSIANCYNIGEVSGVNNRNVGGVCGNNDNNSLITNCYYFDEYYNETDRIDGTSAEDERGFQNKNGVTEFLNNNDSIDPLVWYQGSEYPRLIPYRASESDPYEIYTADDLFWFAAQVNAGNNSISGKLMEDIELNPGYTFTFIPDTGLVELKNGEEIKGYFGTGIKGESGGTDSAFDINASHKGVYYSTEYEATDAPNYLRTWTTIGNDFTTYTGNFDGNNHTVSGLLYCNPTSANIGLFASVGPRQEEIEGNITYIGGEISNIGVINSYICGGENVGGISGWSASGTISSCYNSGIVIGDNKVGGVCGNNIGSITNCYNTGTVNGGNYAGGVCGVSEPGTISNCYNTGLIRGNTYTGGVCGALRGNNDNATISNCYNTGAVIGGSEYTGGVCGNNGGGNISDCYNTGAVSGDNQVCGVCGFNETYGTISNCYNTGSVNGDPFGKICETSSSGSTTSSCYFLAEMEDNDGARTAAQFADGSVAWLLNTNGGKDGYTHSGIWSQSENYPIFADETNKAIYKVDITGAVDKEYYRKSGETFTMPETIHVAAYTEPFTVTTDVAYTADAAITGVTPAVTDTIRFAYDVTVANGLIPTLDVTIGSKTVTLTSSTTDTGAYCNYSFSFDGILPQQMAVNISATLKINSETYAAKSEYSVRTYVFNQLPAANDTLKKFLVNMLCYGAAAQQYSEYHEDDLATNGLDTNLITQYRTSDDAWTADPCTLPSLESKKNVTDVNDTDEITWKSATLVFDKTITMRLRFTTENAAELSEAVFDASFGADINFTDAKLDPKDTTGKTYYIDIEGFTPINYSTTVTVTLNNTSSVAVSDTAVYSVMSYITNMKDDAIMGSLVRALYDYGVSGVAYKESIGS